MKRAGLLLLPLLAGCKGVQSALDPAGEQAARTADLWTIMLWVCGVFYLAVLLFLAAALWRARKRLDLAPVAIGQASPHDRPLQRGLTGWVALVALGLIGLTLASFVIDRQLAFASQDATLKVHITASQWWWKIEYEDPTPGERIVTANELHLPVGRPVFIVLESDDVIHSFWVPNLAGKQDLIPGRINHIVLTPRRMGLFRGQCAEFCGLEHAIMALDATVESPQQFAAWQTAQRQPARPPSNPLLAHGRDVFVSAACASCHAITGEQAFGQVAPNLTHLASRRSIAAGAMPYSKGALAGWLADPQSMKPGNHMPFVALPVADRLALVDYLDSLK